MPLRRATKDGKKGYKFGEHGTFYTSRAKAARQGRAIKASQSRAKKRG